MKILSFERAPPDARGGGTATLVARFGVEIVPGLKLHNLKLLKSRGAYRVYAASTGGQRNSTFAPAIAADITTAAVAVLTGRTNPDAHPSTQ